MPKYKMTRSPLVKVAVDEINAFVEKNGLTHTELSKLSKVSQSQVSKILSGRTKKPNEGLIKICRYAGIKFPPKISEVHMDPRITAAISKVWDGREETIELIARMIECAAHVSGIKNAKQATRRVT